MLKLKVKSISIYLGDKFIDNKTSILFSFLNYTEIMNQLVFKKGTIFYEYLVSCLLEYECLDEDILYYDMINIIKDLIESTKLDIRFDLEEDLEKMILGFANFKLNLNNSEETIIIFKKLLKSYLERNKNKISIIFYDSSIIPLDLEYLDSCYFFDTSNFYDLNKYNILCWKEIKEFDKNLLINRIEGVWPVEFDRVQVNNSIEKYFIYKTTCRELRPENECDVITCHLLNQIYEEVSNNHYNNVQIRNNVKSFLEQF